jgi:3-phenylpropionate/trans-cinnamate dioxygenase ferredoxin subunit
VAKIRVAAKSEIAPGGVLTCWLDKRRIALVCSDKGELYALSDFCPHQQAPLATGRLDYVTDAEDVGQYHLTGTQVLRCPWHGYEFDLVSGRALADPERFRVKTYPVTVEGDDIFVERDTAPSRTPAASDTP